MAGLARWAWELLEPHAWAMLVAMLGFCAFGYRHDTRDARRR